MLRTTKRAPFFCAICQAALPGRPFDCFKKQADGYPVIKERQYAYRERIMRRLCIRIARKGSLWNFYANISTSPFPRRLMRLIGMLRTTNSKTSFAAPFFCAICQAALPGRPFDTRIHIGKFSEFPIW